MRFKTILESLERPIFSLHLDNAARTTLFDTSRYPFNPFSHPVRYNRFEWSFHTEKYSHDSHDLYSGETQPFSSGESAIRRW